MEEKIITGHKNGMLVLLLELVLYIAAVVFLIVGINAGFLRGRVFSGWRAEIYICLCKYIISISCTPPS